MTHAVGVTAAHQVTASIPIVMMVFADPIAVGLIDNLAHPGGNITGSTFFSIELMAKRKPKDGTVIETVDPAAAPKKT